MADMGQLPPWRRNPAIIGFLAGFKLGQQLRVTRAVPANRANAARCSSMPQGSPLWSPKPWCRSQLERLISTSTISVLSCSKAVNERLKSSIRDMRALHHFVQQRRQCHSRRSPHSISFVRFWQALSPASHGGASCQGHSPQSISNSPKRHSSSEPDCVTRLVCQAWSTSHSVAAHCSRTNIPLARAGLREAKPLSKNGISPEAGTVRRPESARTDQILVDLWKKLMFELKPMLFAFHDGAFDNDARSYIFPERNEQFARECYNGRPLQAASIAANTFVEPLSQRGTWLMS
jgi:hypothetical protein